MECVIEQCCSVAHYVPAGTLGWASCHPNSSLFFPPAHHLRDIALSVGVEHKHAVLVMGGRTLPQEIQVGRGWHCQEAVACLAAQAGWVGTALSECQCSLVSCCCLTAILRRTTMCRIGTAGWQRRWRWAS